MKVHDFFEGLPNGYTKHFFRSAFAAAERGDGVGSSRQSRHGAVVVSGARILARGYNQYKTHTALAAFTKWPFLHAESHAIIRCGLDNCTDNIIFSVRLRKNGNIGLANPCHICRAFMRNVGISTVYYTTDTGYICEGL